MYKPFQYKFIIQKKNKTTGRFETWYSFQNDKNRHVVEMSEIFPGSELRVKNNPKYKGLH